MLYSSGRFPVLAVQSGVGIIEGVDQAAFLALAAFMCCDTSRTAVSISVSSPASARVRTSFTNLDTKVDALAK